MAKAKTSIFFCQNCGYESAKWMGQCPGCREWNTFVEEPVDRMARSASGKLKPVSEAKPVPLSSIQASQEDRISTGFPELDRVLGGGIVRGSLVLVGGDPGIGKSTLLLQMCRNLSAGKHSLLSVSGEESLQQMYSTNEEQVQEIEVREHMGPACAPPPIKGPLAFVYLCAA